MQDKDRAKIFMPFDALNGFREALRSVEKIHEEKKELSSDIYEELNNKINSLKVGDIVVIEHFYNEMYIKTQGIIKKINKNYRYIIIDNSNISFDDIIYLDFPNIDV